MNDPKRIADDTDKATQSGPHHSSPRHARAGHLPGTRTALGLALTCALTLNLSACDRDTAPAPPKPVALAASLEVAAPAWPASDPSLPDAASVFAAQDAAERAKAVLDAATALNTSGPPNTMSKEQESSAMPLKGQANDHSTAARDDKAKAAPAK